MLQIVKMISVTKKVPKHFVSAPLLTMVIVYLNFKKNQDRIIIKKK